MFRSILTSIMGIYIKTKMHIGKICDDFFLQKETFPNEFVYKNRERFFCLNFSLLKIMSFMRQRRKMRKFETQNT